MQVTRSQAARALETVRRRRARASVRHRRPRGVGRRAAAVSVSPMTIDRALRTISAQPRIRVALVEAASARLAAGERPSADAVAEMAIRRATCDLLR
ncbi:MAG TPA: hypothetical protein VFZ77_16145 [Acidimicrobiales bacterium]